jgi:hypothetical protein
VAVAVAGAQVAALSTGKHRNNHGTIISKQVHSSYFNTPSTITRLFGVAELADGLAPEPGRPTRQSKI